MAEGTRNCRLALTLIEVLIVLAVLAILAAILLPVLAQARAVGRGAVCVSNARHLGLALALYRHDYDGRYPGAGKAWRARGSGWVYSPWWGRILVAEGSLWPYTAAGIYRCLDDVPWHPISFALSESVEHLAESAIRHPAALPVLVEQREADSLGRGGIDDGLFAPEAWYDKLTDRHAGRGTLLFADGHVGRWSSERLDCGVACRVALFAP